MVGENATNDMVEEGSDNDGNERNGVREVSAGDEQSRMRIKLDSLICLVKRKLQDHYVLLNRRHMLQEWHTTRYMFHSEIGVQSVLQVADEVLRTDETQHKNDLAIIGLAKDWTAFPGPVDLLSILSWVFSWPKPLS